MCVCVCVCIYIYIYIYIFTFHIITMITSITMPILISLFINIKLRILLYYNITCVFGNTFTLKIC